MKWTNKLVTVFFCTVLFILSVLTGGALFIRKLDDHKTIQQFVNHLDLSDVLQDLNVNTSMKNALGDIVNSDDFKDIVTTYANGFVVYLIDGHTDIKVSHEQIETLLTNHKDELLNSIPGGQYIPADLIQSFLLEYVNIDDLLPKYSDLSSEVPIEMVRVLRLGSSNAFLGCLVALMIGSMVMIIFVKKNIMNSLKPIAFSLYASAVFFFILPRMDIFQSQTFASIDNACLFLMRGFYTISMQVLVVSMLINLLDIYYKRKKGKKYA